MALDVLEKKQLETQLHHLQERYPNKIDSNMVIELQKNMEQSNQEFPYMIREILELFKQDHDKLNTFFIKYGIHHVKKTTVEKENQEIKHTLDMSEITDFTRNGKTYIKITYDDGRIKMIEHRENKNTKQILEDIQKIKHLNSLSGSANAALAFQELLKDYIEIPFENKTSINEEKYDEKAQGKFDFVKMNFPNKKILASLDENLFIVEGNPNMTIEVSEIDGKYQIKPMEEMNYVANKNEYDKQPNTGAISYSIEELKRMTEGMTEEEMAGYFRMHGKNPGEIMMILLALEEAKTKQEVVLKKPKQKVLQNHHLNGKMAAFVNTLTLAFLVGVISGCIFFAMLGFILHTLY